MTWKYTLYISQHFLKLTENSEGNRRLKYHFLKTKAEIFRTSCRTKPLQCVLWNDLFSSENTELTGMPTPSDAGQPEIWGKDHYRPRRDLPLERPRTCSESELPRLLGSQLSGRYFEREMGSATMGWTLQCCTFAAVKTRFQPWKLTSASNSKGNVIEKFVPGRSLLLN